MLAVSNSLAAFHLLAKNTVRRGRQTGVRFSVSPVRMERTRPNDVLSGGDFHDGHDGL